jgi:thiamine-monophosphate kinase
VLTLALREANARWLAPFAQALGEDAKHFGCALLGGDTVSTPGPLMISITAFGRVPQGRMVRRSGAVAGDVVVVTGAIGDATLGLSLLKQGNSQGASATQQALIARYRVPQPRTALAAAVRDHASAAMDVSDGLAGDLAKLCKASGVSAEIKLEQVPISVGARAALGTNATTLEALISGGDDYEILCTLPQSRLAAFQAAAGAAGIEATAIGAIREGTEPPRFIAADGNVVTLKRGSFSHF